MCGIFGIITPKPRKLDQRAFCVLGVNNDSRGGDSCGIFIDRKYEYGVNEYKLFYNFFPKSKLLNSINRCQVALGHCRKASVGAINAANAQPVVIRNPKTSEVEFALIHNGTIINYLEMAKKYIPNVDVKDMTDSQVMAQIFYHAGYDVLGEYIGAGAFVMVDYRTKDGQPRVFFFKGESKNTQYATTTTIERPLFCTYSTTEFIFSSIMDYLKALRPGREVLTINANKLLELEKDGKLYIVKEYDRKNLWQTRSSYSTVNTNYAYGGYNDIHNIRQRGTESHLPFYNNYDDDEIYKRYWGDVVEMDKQGVYWIGTNRAHGLHWVDAIGNIEQRKMAGTIQVAFWKGVLLKNPACFTFLNKVCKEFGCSHEELLYTLQDLVHYLSPASCWRTERGQWVTSDTPNSNFLYTGTAIFPFTTEEVYFSAGKLDYYTDGIPYKDALLDLQLCADYKVEEDANATAFY